MNWDQVEGNWKTYKGKIKERWGELTNQQVDVIAGKHDQLIGELQKTYGIAREEAEREIDDFLSKASGDKSYRTDMERSRKAG